MQQTINPNDPRAASVLSALQKVLLSLKDNLTAAPRSYPKLAAAIGVDTATLWRHRKADPRVDEIAEMIIRAGKAGRLPRTTSSPTEKEPLVPKDPGDDDLTVLPEEELQVRAVQALSKARWAMQRFVGRGRHQKHLSDLPRAVYDLERSMAQAGSVLRDLRQLADEWLRRQGGLEGRRRDEQQDLPLDLS